MEVTTLLLTYQRPNVLSNCLNTLINNTQVIPKEFWILDDGSEPAIQANLLSAAQDLSRRYTPTHTVFAGRNRGIGYNFEQAYNIMRMSESDGIFAFIEADYVWRKGWLEDVLAVFEASPWTVAIAGVDHPDMIDRAKTHGTFVDLMVEQFGQDLDSREQLYKEIEIETATRGKIKCRPVSNSCGCQFIHWGRLKHLLKVGEESEGLLSFSTKSFWNWMDRAFHKNGTGERRFASDAHMSGTLSKYSEEWMKYNGVDITKNFGMLSISDFSISSHICGGGVNGGICPEGSTFVVSPTFDEKYLDVDPRKC
jgi:hypothetical protein